MLYLIEIYSYYALFDRNILVVYGFRAIPNADTAVVSTNHWHDLQNGHILRWWLFILIKYALFDHI